MGEEQIVLTGRERSLANLEGHKFRPGQSGNPSGRPKNVLSRALRRKLDELESDEPGARTNAEAIADKLVELAKAGNIEAARLIGDRAEGKPRQSISVTTDSRERIERAVDTLVETARARGDALSRSDALTLLAEYDEEAAALLEAER